MEITPLNRFILIEPVPEKEEDRSTVLVPDSYMPKSLYGQAHVLSRSKDCKILVDTGDQVVVDNSMIQEIKVGEETKYLILENHILCVLEEN
jgi:co-chaperonin GroES (HSP10)